MLESNNIAEIVKCSHCNTILSSENFNNHECNLKLKSHKRIEVIYFQDESYRNKKLMTAWGTDGVLYTFEVVPRKAIPVTIPLNRRKVTPFRTDEDVPEPENVESRDGCDEDNAEVPLDNCHPNCILR